MKSLPEYVQLYFKGEKNEVIIILIVLGIFIATSIFLLIFSKDGYLKGATTVLLILSILLSMIALPILIRTRPQVNKLERTYSNNINEFRTLEQMRMNKVINNYKYYIAVYITFIIIAIALTMFTTKEFYKGIALGLIVIAIFGMVVDHYSKKRAKIYYHKLINE